MASTEPLPGELADALARAADRLGIFRDQIRWYADASSTNDIAAALGVQPVSVRSTLSRARRRIRLRILEQHPHLLEDYEP